MKSIKVVKELILILFLDKAIKITETIFIGKTRIGEKPGESKY